MRPAKRPRGSLLPRFAGRGTALFSFLIQMRAFKQRVPLRLRESFLRVRSARATKRPPTAPFPAAVGAPGHLRERPYLAPTRWKGSASLPKALCHGSAPRVPLAGTCGTRQEQRRAPPRQRGGSPACCPQWGGSAWPESSAASTTTDLCRNPSKAQKCRPEGALESGVQATMRRGWPMGRKVI